MSLAPVTSSTHLSSASPGTNRGNVLLHGRRLRILQTLWVILVISDLVVLIISLPAFYTVLHSTCTTYIASCESDQLNPQSLAALQQAGISIHVYALYVMFWDMLTTLSFLLIGALIIWRRPNTWMGLFVSFFLLNFGSIGVSVEHLNALNTMPVNSLYILLSIIGMPLMILAYLCMAFFFFTFPDGRLVPRWSWSLVSLWLVNFVFWGVPADSPFNINNWPLLLGACWLSIVFGGSLATQIYRYRRVASPVQRQQIKWLIYGFTPVILLPVCLGFVVLLFPGLNGPDSLLHIGLEPLFRFYYLPIPFCIGIALLRYRLWDIDRIINRTLVYGLLTGILAGLYLGLVLGLQFLFDRVAGPAAANSPLILVGSTLIIAALFQPLRLRIQRIIDRRFYRSKYDARRTIASFSTTLRGEVELAQLSEQLVAVVEETMQPAHVSLWLNKPQQSRSAFYKEKESAAGVS